ncbi:penicillin-binding protein 1A [Elusimicrobiota bacterium]
MQINKRLYFLIIALAATLIFAFANSIRDILGDLPSISELEDYTPNLVTKIYDRNGDLVTELFTERRTLIPINEIPEDLKNAILAIEDNNFYNHWGISLKGILRAAYNNIVRRRVAQGGSTITQQLAKSIFLSPRRTLKRKIRELALTVQLERDYSKDEILQLYFNQIYLGAGAYGVSSAARMYFDKEVSELTLGECSMLAGLPRAPNWYSPFRDKHRAAMRRSVVLSRMRELGFITDEQLFEANAEIIDDTKEKIPRVAPYFVEYVRLELEPKYGTNMIYQGGLSIYTTLDIKAQKAAEESLEKYLTEFDEKKHEELFSKDESTETVKPIVQGALIAIDPKTGGIRALIGGRNFGESQFNRALQAQRQPGSAFKAFVYTAALDSGFTPATIVEDTPLVYVHDGLRWTLPSTSTGYLKLLASEDIEDPMKVWIPRNYGNRHYGKMPLRRAVERSINICAIKTIDEIGPRTVIEYARKMGIESHLTPHLSLALGSSVVTLMEIVSAFGVLDSGGIRTKPYSVTRVEDKNGRILEETFPVEEEVLSPALCYVMTNILRGVVQNGTARRARALRRPCAGKTGTTNDASDAWFIGFTPQIVAGVWVGYDDMTTLGDRMTGGRVACPIWVDFMKGALDGEPILNFNPPEGVNFALINPETGMLALSSSPGAYLEAFVKGTEPRSYYPEERKRITNTTEDEAEYTDYIRLHKEKKLQEEEDLKKKESTKKTMIFY